MGCTAVEIRTITDPDLIQTMGRKLTEIVRDIFKL